MARRRKGRPVNGWLVVDKPIGVGSTQVVSKARWALRAQKAGHAGTLDPLATGVLAIAFGEATKTVPYAMDSLKRYRFTVRWGEARNSDDLEGEVTARSGLRPSQEEILAQLGAFQGEVMQRPPNFSAIKIDGARAYDLARDGETLELAERPIWIEALTLLETPSEDDAVFEMTCGKGGYVRSVARDLGVALGCGGHIIALRRLWAGPFALKGAIPFEKLDEFRDMDDAETHLSPVSTGLDDIPALAVSGGQAAQLRQGRAIPITGALAAHDLSYGDAAWASLDGEAVAIGAVKGGLFHPSRVLNCQPIFDPRKDDDVDHNRA
ncbi:MAG: tRNA pseudouridine(55) synthase TruB [Rhodobacteraceae bacterium]|nr:tRNA pseudouridine(55) synthase TruB [Paracoccaceae bacterium]